MNRIDLYNMDCRDAMSLFLPDNSVDAIVCDPPYGLAFMGKKWDYDVPGVDIWAECLRVLKPGGHLLAFAGTRTQHRMAVRIEDAGFEIRDLVMWHHGQGFPKSKNLGGGFGSALKPATEPITMARKPCVGTLESNFAQWGTGALNIDGCRVEADDGANRARPPRTANAIFGGGRGTASEHNDAGRWPANLIHDGSADVIAGFPQAKGQQGALTGSEPSSKTANTFGDFAGRVPSEPRGDTGSAARFFHECKGCYTDDLWQDLNLPQESANTAEQSSFQQRQAAVSALVLAANSALPEGLLCSGLSMAPSTSATGSELRLIADSVTQTIQSIDSRFWHESKPARLTLSLNHASDAEIQRLTDTTTITVNRWKLDGSAEPVTFSITQKNSEAGEKDCAPSMDGKRFIYCAKASKKDRDEGLDDMPDRILAMSNQAKAELTRGVMHEGKSGMNTAKVRKNNHPTVKPTELMAYLCRLVTPPGGVVLDPFMGSGSTGKAALREGFGFIGCEMDAAYFAIAQARLAAVKATA